MSDEPSAPLGPDDPLRAFVEHERARRLDPAQKARLAARLGVGGGGSPPALSPPRGPAAPRATTAMLSLGALALAGIATLGAWAVMRGAETRERTASTSAPATTPPATPPATTPPTATPPTTTTAELTTAEPASERGTPEVSPVTRVATEAPARTAPARTAPARTEPAGTATSEAPGELALLGRARAALATHPEVTLALCAEHASRYPEGVLREEREVLAIDALVATGRESQARARAVRFEAAFPQSVHRPHVSQALERFDAPSAAR